MTDVLHLQTRAYPLHYNSPAAAAGVVRVPGHGDISFVPGTLSSLAYGGETTVEADLTTIITAAVALPGTVITACRARVLPAGAVLVTYALRHETDLRSLDSQALAAFDAQVNQAFREADREVLAQVLDAAVRRDVFGQVAARPFAGQREQPARVDPRSVRYNCHLLTRQPPWSPDPRTAGLVPGPGCQVLLPFTYAWDGNPASPLDDILGILEPADLAVAQLSLLYGAITTGRRILAELARAEPGRLGTEDFRRFLDGVWADYHHLDSYRLESAQDHRANFLAAREVTGVDGTRSRAERLLGHVAASLLAESSARSERLDGRLNRVAAALTVVTAASFLLDLGSFLAPDEPFPARAVTVVAILALAAAALAATILPGRAKRRDFPAPTERPRRARRSFPSSAEVIRPSTDLPPQSVDGEATGAQQA